MAGARRRFGWLFAATVGLALLVLGSWPFWGSASEQWQAWEYARQLRDPTPGAKVLAVSGLVALGPPALGWMIGAALDDPDPQVRRLVCANLVRTDPEQPDRVVAALLATLRDPDVAVRRTAAEQLGSAGKFLIGRAGPESGPRVADALAAALGDRADEVRRQAAIALGDLGPEGRPATAALDGALAGGDGDLRVYAAWALLKVDRAGARDRVIAALIAMLTDPAIVRECWRLDRILFDEIGVDGMVAVLVPRLRHPDPATRRDAVERLMGWCPDAAATRPVALDALDAPDGGLRCEAAFFLLERGDPLAPRAIATLVEQLVNPRDGSYTIEDLVKRVREQSPGSIGDLVAGVVGFRGEEPKTSFLAIHAWRVIGSPAALPAAPRLRDLLPAPDEAVRAQAAEALAEIDPPSALPAIPRLMESARPGREVGIRLTALAALGKIGPAAAGAVPTLVELVDEQDIAISAGAIEALGRVDPPRAAALKRAIIGGR